uniref:splicing regulator SDE2 isoform X1 n=2 Tax=Myxine glutinosa TaxID=7769 RepID=UPI00358F8B7B
MDSKSSTHEVWVAWFGAVATPLYLPNGATVGQLKRHVQDKEGSQIEDFWVSQDGRRVEDMEVACPGKVYYLQARLLGGKGGFGSMLRALGAQIEKTTNREACRDLSGRRLRDVNNEKAMTEWLREQEAREAEREQERLERLERRLAGPSGPRFADPQFEQQLRDMAESVKDSVMKGLQAASSKASVGSSRKRPCPTATATDSERSLLWIGVEGIPTSDDDSDSSSEGDPSVAKKKADHKLDQDGQGTSSDCDLPGEDSNIHQTGSPAVQGHCSPSATCIQVSTDTSVHVNPGAGTSFGAGASSECFAGASTVTPTPEISSCPSAVEPAPVIPEAQGSNVVLDNSTGCSNGVKESKTNANGNDSAQEQIFSLDLSKYDSVQDFEELGLDVLKSALVARKMKCGGTLHERAVRLFAVRGLSQEEIDPVLLAKPKKLRQGR